MHIDATSATAAARRMIDRGAMSEREFHAKLNLPRGAAFAGRKARPRDLAERGAADDVAWRAEVGVVEQIEDVRANLKADTSVLHGLADRQVGVVKGRTNHHV